MMPLVGMVNNINDKMHLNRFTRFFTAHPCAQHTDTQTTLRVTSVAIEYACPVWHTSPTCEQSNALEAVQRTLGELVVKSSLLQAVNTVKTVVFLTRTAPTQDANNTPRNFLTRFIYLLKKIFHNSEHCLHISQPATC